MSVFLWFLIGGFAIYGVSSFLVFLLGCIIRIKNDRGRYDIVVDTNNEKYTVSFVNVIGNYVNIFIYKRQFILGIPVTVLMQKMSGTYTISELQGLTTKKLHERLNKALLKYIESTMET